MEWVVVTVLIALIGLITAIVKPIISLTKSITTLNNTMSHVQESIKDDYIKNTKSHDRIWEHNKEQDKKIDDHEKRIIKLEK